MKSLLAMWGRRAIWPVLLADGFSGGQGTVLHVRNRAVCREDAESLYCVHRS